MIGDQAPFSALGTNLPALYSVYRLNHGIPIYELGPSYSVNPETKPHLGLITTFKEDGCVRLAEAHFLGAHFAKRVALHELLYPKTSCRQP